jgi:hypothetical protein
MSKKWEDLTIREFKAMKAQHEIEIMKMLNDRIKKIEEDTDLNVGNISVIVKYDTVGFPPRVKDVNIDFAVDLL